MTPDELSAWLETARRIFSEVFRADNVCLRIIVANARNPRQAVEYRTPAPDVASRVYGLANERVEVHFHEQPNVPQLEDQTTGGLPTLNVLDLSDDERPVVRACLSERKTGKELCRALGWPYNGSSRGVFSRLCRLRMISREHGGYLATELGRISLGIERRQ